MKKIISVVLSIILAASSFAVSSFAQDEPYYSGEFSLINANVQGLTSFMGSDCVANSRYMSAVFNEYDIAAVQEDFNYHSWLVKNMELPFRTLHSGITGAGDGMNVFSEFKIYNQKRYKWRSLSGVFDGGSDVLTPKGILFCTLEVYDGVYIDFYDIHADAYGDEGSVAARRDNYIQLCELVEENSAGKAYIITGDFNDPLYDYNDLYTCLVEPLGCNDAWSDICNSGNIPDASVPYNWGSSNSVERVLYKSSETVELKALTHEYKWFTNPENGEGCSDHAAQIVTMSVTATQKQEDFNKEPFNYFAYIYKWFSHVFKTLTILIPEAIKLLFK